MVRHVSSFIATFVFVTPLFASPPSPDLPLTPPPELELPQSTGRAQILVLSAQNAASFKGFVVPELYSSLRSGNLAFNVLKNLNYEPGVAPEADAKEPKSAELLASIEKSLSPLKAFEIDFNLTKLKDERLLQKFRGEFLRLYPTSINEQDKTGQIFREKVRFIKPAVLDGFAWVTFRFPGAEEDVVWQYSPAIKKSRQITGSDRTDGILTTEFALDDLFTWSGKPESVQVVTVSKGTYLTPFPDTELTPGVFNAPCLEVKDEHTEEGEDSARVRWNYLSRRFPDSASWLPTEAVYVPRVLYRLELSSRDPYSVYGRQILYVDAATKLPVYKFVFDRSGHPWKTVISAYGMAERSALLGRSFFPVFTVVDDVMKGESYLLDFTRVLQCDELTENFKLVSFDPKKLGGEDVVPATPATAPDAAAPAVDSPEIND